MNAEVAVVVTTYNHANYVEQLVDSILAQTVGHLIKIYISDDASSDATPDKLRLLEKKFPNSVFIRCRSENVGAGRNFVELFQMCEEPFVVFCDGDDYWLDERKVEIQLSLLKKQSGVIGVSHGVVSNLSNQPLHRTAIDTNSSELITFYRFFLGRKFALTTLLMKNSAKLREQICRLVLDGPRNQGDLVICCCALNHGSVLDLKTSMSFYRKRLGGDVNFNSMYGLREKMAFKRQMIGIIERELDVSWHLRAVMTLWWILKFLKGYAGNLYRLVASRVQINRANGL